MLLQLYESGYYAAMFGFLLPLRQMLLQQERKYDIGVFFKEVSTASTANVAATDEKKHNDFVTRKFLLPLRQMLLQLKTAFNNQVNQYSFYCLYGKCCCNIALRSKIMIFKDVSTASTANVAATFLEKQWREAYTVFLLPLRQMLLQPYLL